MSETFQTIIAILGGIALIGIGILPFAMMHEGRRSHREFIDRHYARTERRRREREAEESAKAARLEAARERSDLRRLSIVASSPFSGKGIKNG